MTTLKRTFFMFILAMIGMAQGARAADFKDFSVVVNNQSGTLLTSEEQVQGTAVSFGVAVASNGTVSRVEAGDESSVATVTGTYHSDHGCTGLSIVVPVNGSVKITVGQCTYSTNTINVKVGGETVVSKTPSSPACWKNNRSNVDELFYKGGPATLTITGMGYCPYVAVEAVNEAPSTYAVAFSLGNETAVGVVPAGGEVNAGESFTIPVNRTLYKDGYTLTNWTDGTNKYAPGASITPASDLELTPVFTQNSVALADRTSEVTLKWDFQRKNGAPTMTYQGTGATGIYVTQATVNNSVIDVKLDFDAINGKINNSGWNDWCQINTGTIFTIPSCKGATVSVEAFNAVSQLTIDGQNDYTSGQTISYTVASSSENIDIVFAADGQYYRYIQAVLPVVNSQEGGTTFNNVQGTVTWAVGNEATPDIASDIAEAISSTSVSMGDGLTVGTATYFDTPMVKYTPTTSNSGTVAGVMIEYRVKAAKGITFKPTSVSYAAVKVGTDNATYSWSYTLDGVESSKTKIDPKPDLLRDNGANSSTAKLIHSHDITTDGVEEFTFRFYISDCANNKQICIGNVVITGTVNGTTQTVETYPLTLAASPEEGGTVSAYPNDENYEAGSEVNFTATPNFGYHFINWTDADNNVVSEDAQFTYTVQGAAQLTANFQAVNTYALNLTVDGIPGFTVKDNPNPYMVEMSPAPTIVDGVSMYEQDTYVTLTAKQYAGLVDFNYWSDGQTSQSIQIKMTQDVDLKAFYSQNDIIAGWDFYVKGNSSRPADFFSEDNADVSFNLVNESGAIVSWLDKSTESAGGYESLAGAAVNWQQGASEGDVGNYYWQTKINASGFTDIKLQFQMLYNYNSYTKYLLDYSTDGQTWTNFGSVTLGSPKAVSSFSGALGEGADNAETLYVRWAPDKTSSVKGSSSKNDGNTIAMVFFTGTPGIVNDDVPPVLVNTVPADGTSDASANGKVVLTFDEKVQALEGCAATLGDLTLTPTVSGRTVSFEYKSLDYSSDFTFTLPAGSIADLSGNAFDEDVVISFSTMRRDAIEKKLYDFVVPWDGTIAEAINAANSRSNTSDRFRIFVLDGTYTLPFSTSATIASDGGNTYPSPITNVTAPNISFIGQSMDGAVITNSAGNGATYEGKYGTTSVYDGIGKSDVLQLQSSAKQTYFQDITIKSGIGDGLGRNLAVQDKASKTIYKNTCLWGYQDTWTSNNDNGLYYFENGKVRGRTDFLCGKGDSYFNAVDIQVCMNTGGYIAVPSKSIKYGYVFNNCTIKGESSSLNKKYTLGRPWGSGTPVAFWINTTMEIVPSDIGWSEMSDGWPKRFAEYNSVNASGNAVDLSGRKKTFGDGHANNPVLTAAEAAEASDMTNMYGDWDPTYYTEQASAPTGVRLIGDQLTWDDSDYVLLWAVMKDGEIVRFTTDNSFTVDDTDATYSLRAANEMGGLGEETVAVKAEGFVLTIGEESADGKGNYYVTLSNMGDGQFVVPAGLELWTVTVTAKGKVESTNIAKADDIVDGSGAYLVVGTGAGDYTFVPTADAATFQPGVNWLYPATENVEITAPTMGDDYLFYKLSLNNQGSTGSVGFYWGVEGGGTFTFTKPNKAYLAVPQTGGNYSGAAIIFADTDKIGHVEMGVSATDDVYTISGMRMKGGLLPKGIYIVNGEKVVVR